MPHVNPLAGATESTNRNEVRKGPLYGRQRARVVG